MLNAQQRHKKAHDLCFGVLKFLGIYFTISIPHSLLVLQQFLNILQYIKEPTHVIMHSITYGEQFLKVSAFIFGLELECLI